MDEEKKGRTSMGGRARGREERAVGMESTLDS